MKLKRSFNGMITFLVGRYASFAARNIHVKIADSEDEFEQIHKLNYDTFVSELGQYDEQPQKRLVDKFNDRNIYFIAKKGGEIVGMISVVTPGDFPFSIESRLSDPSIIHAIKEKCVEIRLLAVSSKNRGTGLFWKLVVPFAEFLVNSEYEYALISGITSKERLYRKLGFIPLGPAVPYGQSAFIPMYITRKEFLPFAKTRKEFNQLAQGA